MTTRRARGRSSFKRGPRPTMAWFNNGLDIQSLPANTNATSILTSTAPPMPAGFPSGFTILRCLVKLVIKQDAAGVDAEGLAALYVAADGSLVTPPDLNADLMDYYWFQGIQVPSNTALLPKSYDVDLRSGRKVRGEDRGLIFQLLNTSLVNPLTFGLEVRMLLKRS